MCFHFFLSESLGVELVGHVVNLYVNVQIFQAMCEGSNFSTLLSTIIITYVQATDSVKCLLEVVICNCLRIKIVELIFLCVLT